MADPRCNKLSIDFLCTAFTREEALGGRIFAAFGKAPVLETIRAFLKALGRDHTFLWTASFVESGRVPEETLVLGALYISKEHAFPRVEDFARSLEYGLSDIHVDPERTGCPPAEVWGRLVRL